LFIVIWAFSTIDVRIFALSKEIVIHKTTCTEMSSKFLFLDFRWHESKLVCVDGHYFLKSIAFYNNYAKIEC
jgi:hypothetical protein